MYTVYIYIHDFLSECSNWGLACTMHMQENDAVSRRGTQNPSSVDDRNSRLPTRRALNKKLRRNLDKIKGVDRLNNTTIRLYLHAPSTRQETEQEQK